MNKIKYVVFGLLTLSLFVGCGKKEKAEETMAEEGTASTMQASPIDPATVGNIMGKIMVSGTAPKPSPIKMDADAACKGMHSQPVLSNDVVVNKDNTLKNVFVHIKEGLEGRAFETPKTPIVLDQQGCMYAPHVFGVQAGQPIDILNSDPTLHNVHAWATANASFNIGQPTKGMKTTKVFDKSEVMVKFKCDVHSWMISYAGVVNHPYFGVTGDNGTFELKSVPPGKYKVSAWHEKFGEQVQEVTLGDKETKTVDFTFNVSM
jgi:plastocyanin